MKKLLAGVGIAAMLFVFGGSASASSIKKVLDSSTASITRSFLVDVFMDNVNALDLDVVVSSTGTSGANTVTSGDSLTTTTVITGDSDATNNQNHTGNLNVIEEIVESDEDDGTAGPAIEDVEDSSTASIDDSDEIFNDMTSDNSGPVVVDATADGLSGGNTVTSVDDHTGTSVTAGKAFGLNMLVTTIHSNIKSIMRTVGD